jgi:hypothetical protein
MPWWTLLQQAVGQELIQQAMAYELPVIELDTALRFDQQATLLCVKVTEGGEQRVAIKMPAEAVLDLEQLIPEDVMQRIKESGKIDFQQIHDSIRTKGIVPQRLFVFEDDKKIYNVWLE